MVLTASSLAEYDAQLLAAVTSPTHHLVNLAARHLQTTAGGSAVPSRGPHPHAPIVAPSTKKHTDTCHTSSCCSVMSPTKFQAHKTSQDSSLGSPRLNSKRSCRRSSRGTRAVHLPPSQLPHPQRPATNFRFSSSAAFQTAQVESADYSRY